MKNIFILLIVSFGIFDDRLSAEETEYNIHSLNLFTPTNRSFKAVVNGLPVFLRIGRENPEEVGIDREREIKNLQVGEQLGLAPSILGYELNNGLLITEFIEGSTPTKERMHDLQFLRNVVTNIHELHAYQTERSQEVEKTMFDVCRLFFDSLKTLNATYDAEQVFFWLNILNTFEKGYYDSEPKAVCHGDLYHGNLLETAEGKVYFIDWEYSFFGYVVDDLGKLCSDDLSDQEIQFIVATYWGMDRPDMFLKLKQNVFIHELSHYFWCLIQAHNIPENASKYDQRARLMQEHLNQAASIIGK